MVTNKAPRPERRTSQIDMVLLGSDGFLEDPCALPNISRAGVTGNQKPIIARHPDHINLVIAGGGSYTHAKDLPYIGRVVTEVVQGTEIHSQILAGTIHMPGVFGQPTSSLYRSAR